MVNSALGIPDKMSVFFSIGKNNSFTREHKENIIKTHLIPQDPGYVMNPEVEKKFNALGVKC
jgi:hypothetical protein